MATLAQYHTAFAHLQSRQQIDLARAAFASILQSDPQDQTALEFHKLLAGCGDNLPYRITVSEPVVACYQPAHITAERLEIVLQHAGTAAAYVHRWPLLRPLPLFVLVLDEAIRVAHADYKMRPLVPKIRVHPLCHLSTIAHEVAHLAFPCANRFVAEGFAMYVASCLTQWQESDHYAYFRHALSDATDLLPLSELTLEHEDRLHYFAEAAPQHQKILAYHEAGSFIAYLLDRFAFDRLWNLAQKLETCEKSAEIHACFVEIYAFSLAQLETSWKEASFPAESTSTAADDSRSQRLVSILQRPPLPPAQSTLRDPAQLEALIAEYEITLPLEHLAALIRYLTRLRCELPDAPDGNDTERAIYLYYAGRVALALLNSLELEIDWLYEDIAHIAKTVAGFTAIRQQGVALVEQSIELLQSLNKNVQEESHIPAGEIHRLLGEFYGRLIKYKGKFAAITYGAQCGRELETARRLNAGNVRTLTALGRSKLFTPKLFGGGVQAAKSYFESAAEIHPLFSESHIGLALCSYLENNLAAFQSHLEQALAIHHGDRCAQKLLHKFRKGEVIIKT
jgi:hypothetical protein